MISTLILGWKDIILWPLLTITSLFFVFLKIVTFVAWWLSSHYLNEQPNNHCHVLYFFVNFILKLYIATTISMLLKWVVYQWLLGFLRYFIVTYATQWTSWWWILCSMSIFFATFVTFVIWQSLPYCSNEHGDGCHVVCVFVFWP